jgi:Polyketide cyclase / dehydrase and lipid transport
VEVTDLAVDVKTETTIARPVEVVAAFALDPANAPEWYDNIDSVEWETPPPAQVGSKVAFVARFLGRRLAYTYELVELVPGERLAMRTAQGPFPMETTYTWQPVGEGATLMTLRNRGEPSGFSRLTAPFMATAMRRANRQGSRGPAPHPRITLIRGAAQRGWAERARQDTGTWRRAGESGRSRPRIRSGRCRGDGRDAARGGS